MVSPDYDRRRSEVLSRLRSSLPDYKFLTIPGITYADYLAKIATARFALTFGEGLDSYFVETVFSGGLGVAVFNSVFREHRGTCHLCTLLGTRRRTTFPQECTRSTARRPRRPNRPDSLGNWQHCIPSRSTRRISGDSTETGLNATPREAAQRHRPCLPER